jgi:hypothetical protein
VLPGASARKVACPAPPWELCRAQHPLVSPQVRPDERPDVAETVAALPLAVVPRDELPRPPRDACPLGRRAVLGREHLGVQAAERSASLPAVVQGELSKAAPPYPEQQEPLAAPASLDVASLAPPPQDAWREEPQVAAREAQRPALLELPDGEHPQDVHRLSQAQKVLLAAQPAAPELPLA